MQESLNATELAESIPATGNYPEPTTPIIRRKSLTNQSTNQKRGIYMAAAAASRHFILLTSPTPSRSDASERSRSASPSTLNAPPPYRLQASSEVRLVRGASTISQHAIFQNIVHICRTALHIDETM